MEVKEEKKFFSSPPLILLTFSEDDSMSLGRGGGERGRRERLKVRGEKERTTFSLSTQLGGEKKLNQCAVQKQEGGWGGGGSLTGNTNKIGISFQSFLKRL